MDIHYQPNEGSEFSLQMLKVFETLPNPYLILSPELTILTASNIYLEITLTKREYIVGKSIFDIFPDNPAGEGITQVQASLQQVLATHQPHQMDSIRYDLAHPMQAGKFIERYWRTSHTPVSDQQGNIQYIIHHTADVTEQVKTANQLQALQKQTLLDHENIVRQFNLLQNLLYEAPVAMCFFQGDDQVIASANRLICDMWGYAPERVLGKPLMEAVPELKGQGFDELIRKVYQTGIPFHGKEVAAQLLRQGKLTTSYFNFVYQPLHDTQGTIIGVIDVAIDVTEEVLARKKAAQNEEQLQELNKQLRVMNQELMNARAEAEHQRHQLHHIFMQAPALICLFEGPGHIFTFVNPPYQKLVGERPLLGKPIAEAMPELAGQPIFDLLNNVYHTGETFYAYEMKVQLDHDNTGRLGHNYYNFIYQATRNLAGVIDGIMVFAYEVTAQVIARQKVEDSERELQTLNEQLAQANQTIVLSNQELNTAYQEIQAANEELLQTGQQMSQLNELLEARVIQRTNELKLSEAETERQRARLERFFMQAPAAICVLDGPSMIFELVNPSYQQLFPDRALLGKPVLEALPEIAGQPIQQILENVYQTGESFEGKEVLVPFARYKNGPLENIYFNFIYQARFNEQAIVDGILVFAYEVTDLVKARRTTEQTAQQLRLLTDALPVSIVYVDNQKRYQFANKTALDWRQGKGESIVGKVVQDVVGVDTYLTVKDDVDRALAGENIRFEKQITYPNGVRYTQSQYVPHLEDGQVQGFYALVVDISEQVEARHKIEQREKETQALAHELAATNEKLKGANEELSRSNQQLSYINADLDNFIYTASHDLRAPISNIEGLMKLIVRNLSPESKQNPTIIRLLGLIEDSVERFKKTLDELTQVTKIQREESEEQMEEVDLAQIIQEVKLDLASQIEQADAKIDVHTQGCFPIHYSPKNARSIVYNLLSNAIKYHSPKRKPIVRVSCYRQSGYLVLTVEDNGLGMDLSRERKIFAMFKRLHDHVEGSGVGLYIVKKIIENAGGKIEVDSTVDQGSKFRVYFKQ